MNHRFYGFGYDVRKNETELRFYWTLTGTYCKTEMIFVIDNSPTFSGFYPSIAVVGAPSKPSTTYYRYIIEYSNTLSFGTTDIGGEAWKYPCQYTIGNQDKESRSQLGLDSKKLTAFIPRNGSDHFTKFILSVQGRTKDIPLV